MQGDWGPGAKIRPIVVNIAFDANGDINHVGVGYDVLQPSGAVVTGRGYTWTPGAHSATLQAAMNQLLADATKNEGVDGILHGPIVRPLPLPKP